MSGLRYLNSESKNTVLDTSGPLNPYSCRAEGVTYKCHGRGALLSLPHGGYREDAINTKVFEKYIQDNVVSWFDWAQSNQLGVERLEDIILVSGCTLVPSWAAAAFVGTTMDAEISLASKSLNNGGASFLWRNIRGGVLYHNSRHNHVCSTPDVCFACTYFPFVV
jgi:hypothetical protein